MMILPRLCFRIAIVFGAAVPCLLWFAAIGAAQNADRPRPTYADAAYGPHERNVVDFYKVESDEPTPLLVFFHGGGWSKGDKRLFRNNLYKSCMKNGIAFAAANYRFTHHAPHPAQLHDSARAIQFLRSKAAEWNIDPTRIAAHGGSAGGSISLWLALHDDMADPTSDDPVARLSTRLSCAIGLGAQSTNDPRVIREIIPGKAYNEPALKPLFGLPADWDWDTAEVSDDLSARLIEGSPITHLTEDDPPVFVFYYKNHEVPGNIHHANFGRYLKKNMDAMNIECVFSMGTDYKRWPEDQNIAFLAFLRKHFGMKGTKQPKQADGSQDGLFDYETTQGQDKQLVDKSKLKPGDLAPDIELTPLIDFKLESAVQLSSLFKEKPVVLFMGSYTCNLTRDRVPQMEKFYKEYEDRANFAFVYMKDAHPTPSVSVEVDGKKVQLAQPKTLSHRVDLTKHLIDQTGLTLPIYLDDMKGSGRKAYSGYHLAAYIISTDGKLVFLRRYRYEVADVEAALNSLLNASNTN